MRQLAELNMHMRQNSGKSNWIWKKMKLLEVPVTAWEPIDRREELSQGQHRNLQQSLRATHDLPCLSLPAYLHDLGHLYIL